MFHTKLSVTCNPAFSDILIAELSQARFDAFLETEAGFEAYAEGDEYDATLVDVIREKYQSVTPLEFSFSRVDKRNWNEEWEKSFSPIIVEDTCLIRASFHEVEKQYPYEIVITPKMSFGTGHHQTTWLMVKNMLQMDYRGKRVMDAGCGTAILSILASRLGAAEVEAFDIDEWSVTNGNENIAVNQSQNIRIQRGTIREVQLKGVFDIVLANINKNVLLDELQVYASYLQDGGRLLLSGFFTSDIDDLVNEGKRFGMKVVHRDERDTWAALLLAKTS